MQRRWSLARMGGALIALCLLLVGFMAQAGPAAAYSATFANNAPIPLNTTGPNNTPPNPSTITVSGFATGIQSLTVKTFNSSKVVNLNLSGPTAGQNYNFTIPAGDGTTQLPLTNVYGNDTAGTAPNGFWTLSVLNPTPAANPAAPDSIAGGWSLAIVAQPAPTTTTLTVTPNPSVYGTTSYTLKATVLATTIQQAPTGIVTFSITGPVINTVTLGSVGLVSSTANSSTATYTFDANSPTNPALLPAGSYTVTANYQGNGDFVASQDSAILVINKAATSTTQVTATPSTFAYGTTSFGVSAVVTNTSNNAPLTSSGSVQFSLVDSANVTICTVTIGIPANSGSSATVSGTCTFSSNGISAGGYTLKAAYSGDQNFLPSSGSGAVGGVVITKANTSLEILSVSNTPVTCGDASVTVKARVQNASNTASFASPTNNNGSVTIRILSTANGTDIVPAQTIPVPAGGDSNYTAMANFDISGVRTGSYTVTASYSGSDQFNGSTAPSKILMVNKADTSVNFMMSPPSVTYGSDDGVAVQVQVSRVVGAPLVQSGTVTFMIVQKNTSTQIGSSVTANVVNGVASATIPLTGVSVGNYNIVAKYNGDDCYNMKSATSGTVLKVTKRILWIKPVDQTRTSTQANPGCRTVADLEVYRESNGLPPRGTGLANGDTLQSAVTLANGFGCTYSVSDGTAARPTPVGTYITDAYGVLSANYDIRYKPGSLTVTR